MNIHKPVRVPTPGPPIVIAPSTRYGMVAPYFIDRRGAAEDARKILPLFSFPTLAHIEITYACMERCIMCYNPARTPPTAGDKETVWRIVRSLGESRIPHTYLIGGEPTYGYTKSELQDFVIYLSEQGSSVTIVTNGQVTLRGMTDKLACYGVSIHGADACTHDRVTQVAGSWERAVRTAREYVGEGHDVRIISVLMGFNHDQVYRISELAWKIGAESVYYDIYEPGGIGEVHSHNPGMRLCPSHAELREGISQMIRARDDFSFRGGVGLGTALPYCFDERLIERNMVSNCGVGSYFCAITNQGDFRICNQSKMVFGNVLARPIEAIWRDPAIDDCFRSLRWVEEPCVSCPVLEECGGGCKVDEGCSSGEFCIDRLVRGLPDALRLKLQEGQGHRAPQEPAIPERYRIVRPNPFLAITDRYASQGDIFFKTRYQTVRINESERLLLSSLIESGGIVDERDFIAAYEDQIDAQELRRFVTMLVLTGAIDVMGVA